MLSTSSNMKIFSFLLLLFLSHQPSPPTVTDDYEPLSEILTQYRQSGMQCDVPSQVKCQAVDMMSVVTPWLLTGQVSTFIVMCFSTNQVLS